MHDALAMEAVNTATIQLVNASWSSYLQRVCQGLRSIGRACRGDGAEETLLRQLKRTRPSTYAHSIRVAKFSRATGIALGFDDARLKQLGSAALLHDIGKILIPEAILNRPRKPTATELFVLHKHPSFGAMLASYFNLPSELGIRTRHHHERWDGKGYPRGLAGKDIPLIARIVQVADTYDAMVAKDRPYRRPLAHAEALKEVRDAAGTQFDPQVSEAFIDTFSKANPPK